MQKRPRSITIIGWIFIVFGAVALLSGLPAFAQPMVEFKKHWMVHASRILMILSGVFVLYGFNWARWLMVVWILFHVVIGALHSLFQAVVHALLAAVFLYFLLRPQASAYFRRVESKTTADPTIE